MIPVLPFARLVREISDEVCSGLKWQSDALTALQWASEHILIMIMEMGYCLSVLRSFLINSLKLAYHAKRVTLMDKDVKLLRDLWFYIDPNSPIGKEHAVFQSTRIQVEYTMRRKVDKEREKIFNQ